MRPLSNVSAIACLLAGQHCPAQAPVIIEGRFSHFSPLQGRHVAPTGEGWNLAWKSRHSTHPQQILPLPSPSVQQWSHFDHSDQDLHVELRSCQYHTHTHTRLTALFPGLPGSAGTRKAKPIWILLKQETVSGSGISWAICKPAPSSRQITTPASHHSVFYRPDALPAAQPTASKHWRQYHLADHLILKLWLKRTDTAKGDLETKMSIKWCRVQLKTTNNSYCHQGVDWNCRTGQWRTDMGNWL